jgi:hypothetical protein
MTARRADTLAILALAVGTVIVTWPLLSNLDHVHPPGWIYDDDLLNYYGTAQAAWLTVNRFHQFPLRSPWHGGGYPLYVYPEDQTFTPTMPLILVFGPWAAFKIEFALLMFAGGAGMYVLRRRMMGGSVVGALFSATAFAFGGFLMARWMRGWLATTYAMTLPWVLYALWRGRQRRWWLGLAAVLVAVLLMGHKYVALVMGWFLVMVGLLRLDGEEGQGGLAWGYFGRLVGVWALGTGLAAVKLLPMWPLMHVHMRAWEGPWERPPWRAMALWLSIFMALGSMPLLVRWVRARGARLRGWGGLAGVLAAAIVATALLAPRSIARNVPRRLWLRLSIENLVSFGHWRIIDKETGKPVPKDPFRWTRPSIRNLLGFGPVRTADEARRLPLASDRYRGRAPVGIVVCLLAVVAVFRRGRHTWKWATLAGLFLVMDLTGAGPWDLGESVRGCRSSP